MITFLRTRPAGDVEQVWAETRRREGTTALELSYPSQVDVAACLAAGVLPIAVGSAGTRGAAFVGGPERVAALAKEGVAGWRLTLEAATVSEDIIDAAARGRVAFVRVGRSRVAEVAGLLALPTLTASISVFVDSVDDAVTAAAAGASDLLLRDWDTESIGDLRDALDGLLIERTVFPIGVAIEGLRSELSPEMLVATLGQMDGSGAARPRYTWAPGRGESAPIPSRRMSSEWLDARWVAEPAPVGLDAVRPDLRRILEASLSGRPPNRREVEELFGARGDEVDAIARVADELRRDSVGDAVSYVVNRNINYTNQCYFRCGFCAFSKGPSSLNLRVAPYLLEVHEVAFRAKEAWEAGATEVCLQGGIHPEFTGDFYVALVEAVKQAVPDMHVHGFTPLEVWQGAETLGIGIPEFLGRLAQAGLGTLPGTAAEILDDRVRAHLCPDKLTTAEWAHVMIVAHEMGLHSTATMMFGHIDDPVSWANHFEVLRSIQRRTGGFTEFVPLPFVHMGAPIFLRGRARPGPTWDEVVLVHAVARVAFTGLIDNIQASWVKLGLDGGTALLRAGCNDMGGTLMNENISRAAGSEHGQAVSAQEIEAAITASGRTPVRRTTLYEPAPIRLS